VETVFVPKRLLDEARKRGIDVESLVVDLLVERLGIDPRDAVDVHLELATKFFEEGLELVEKDPVQASEKLYKAMEECVKAVAKLLDLKDVVDRVKARGRWTVTDLERVVRRASEVIGEELGIAWDAANYLHVWGFHEAKLSPESVKARAPSIRRAIELVKNYAEKLLKHGTDSSKD